MSPSWRADELLESCALRLISVTLVMNAGKSPLRCMRCRSFVSVACSVSVNSVDVSIGAGGGAGAAFAGTGGAAFAGAGAGSATRAKGTASVGAAG